MADPYDVIVVGAGITGVCIAREAAGRGLRTLLLERDDFGEGTSSATSKLIHGGIRYLETYQFGVVRESLRERRVLALAAPHLVRQQRFLMPAWRWSKPPTALIGAGVGLYTALGFDRNRHMPSAMRIPLPRWLSRRAVLRAVPWIDPDGLQGAFAYHDTFNLHPERLLLALLGSAVDDGAVALNHVAATGFVTRTDPVDGSLVVEGVEAVDRVTGAHHTARGAVVVNAAGPWIDHVLDRLGRPMGVTVTRSKGVHLLTRPIGGVGQVSDTVFARGRSGRHVIVSPWQGMSFVGPTDTPLEGGPEAVRTDVEDVELIMATVNETISGGVPKLAHDDIIDTTVGVRPLIGGGSDSYTTSRRHELYDHGPRGVANLWSIGGGKWTTARALGEETVERLLRSPSLSGVPTRRFRSRSTAVATAFAWAEDPAPFMRRAMTARPSLDLDPAVVEHLVRIYGTDHTALLDLVEASPDLGQRISQRPGVLDIAAQAVRAVTHESAQTLSDVLDRRLVVGTLGPLPVGEMDRVARVIAPLLGWSDVETAAAVDAEAARRGALVARWRR